MWDLNLVKTRLEKLKKIINERIRLKSKIGDGNYWLNQSSNGFVFVDVLLFAIYLNEDTFNPKELHEDVVYNVILHDQIGPN